MKNMWMHISPPSSFSSSSSSFSSSSFSSSSSNSSNSSSSSSPSSSSSSSSPSPSQESTHPAPSCCPPDFRLRFYKMESNMVRGPRGTSCVLLGRPLGPSEGIWCFDLLPWITLSESRNKWGSPRFPTVPLNPLLNHHCPYETAKMPYFHLTRSELQGRQGHLRLAVDASKAWSFFW